jgi:hypothetical protein
VAHRLFSRSTFMPLGTTLHKQGRVAGENAVRGNAQFAGSLGTQVVKVFEPCDRGHKSLGRKRLEKAYRSVRLLGSQSLLSWHPRNHVFESVEIKVTGRLLGAQLIGHLAIGNFTTSGYLRDGPFTQMRDGASRGIRFEIAKELTRRGAALGINADEYR